VVNNQILLVDDDEVVRFSLDKVLEQQGFVGTTAANVSEALNHINSTVFDVPLTDLHLPRGGDGLTVVSAMRHFKPKAVTTVLSAFPELRQRLVPSCSRPIRFW
jgi:CheY-like chemotaxis protein